MTGRQPPEVVADVRVSAKGGKTRGLVVPLDALCVAR